MASTPTLSWFLPVLVACSGEAPDRGPDVPGNPRKVLVVGWDGAKPDSVQLASTPNLERVASWGGISYAASTQLSHATISAPGWASVLTGVEPEKHGVTFNSFYDERDASWLTFVQRARDAGLRTGVAAVWAEVATDIVEAGAADDTSVGGEDEVADWMATHIEADTFDVHFVHQDAPDRAGHDSGFYPDNPDYISAIEASDVRLGRLLDAIEARTDEDWLVAVTTDHGASGGGHGGMDADNQTIWTAFGTPGQEGEWILIDPNHLDVHPTVLDFLHIPVDKRSVGGVSQLP
jgi:arylsulfatase A-like enzyme